MTRITTPAAIAGLLVLAGCVRPSAPPPAPAPQPPPAPTPVPAPPAADWRDRALTPGDWSYRQAGGRTTASYGTAPAMLTISCDIAARQIVLARPGITAPGATLTLRATEGVTSYPLVDRGGTPAAILPPRDPQLDRIAFSRGRFLVQVAGADDLVVPAWAELSRVIEDCRG